MSRLRTKRWVRPDNVRHWPQLIEQGIHKLRQQCERRCGGLYDLFNGSTIAGRARSRRIRSDGLLNLESFAIALLTSTDLASGVVADPAQADGTSMQQLDVRAYGKPVEGERSQRRAERHAHTLTELGLLETIEQRHKLPERYRSTPAVRSLDLDRLFGLLGLTALLRIGRKNVASRLQRELIARIVEARRARDRRKHFAAEAAQAAAAAQAPAPTPEVRPPDPRTDSPAAIDAQAQIRALLDD